MSPTRSLERLAAHGLASARYHAVMEASPTSENPTWVERTFVIGRLRVTRENGAPIAVLHYRWPITLDLAPDLSDEEAHMLRLVAAAMQAPLEATGR